MKTNKKMNMAMAIVCCAVGLIGPAKADEVSAFCKKYGLLEICDPDGGRDREILTAINNSMWNAIKDANAIAEEAMKKRADVQNVPVVPFGQNMSVVPFSQNVQVVLFNNTALTICGVLIAPCVNHGAAMPQVLSGWLAPMSGVHTVIGAANAYYNIRFLTNGGGSLDFRDVFIGAGTSRIILMHLGQGYYTLRPM